MILMQIKKKSQLQEKSVAKDLDARTVIASGSLWGSKGDVRHDDFLVECKTTEKPYYSLTMKVWEKIEKEAIKDGLRIPLMCIDINNGEDRYAVFLEKHFKHYRSYCEVSPEETCWSDKKSFQVCEPERILMVGFKKSPYGESPAFIVMPWDDFLYMLKGGVLNG